MGVEIMKDWIFEELKKDIGEDRYKHSLSVMETCIKLAKYYNSPIDEAGLAGLLHDCGKFEDRTKILKMAKDFDIILDKIMAKSPQLSHGPLGAYLAEHKYGIGNGNILNAIYYHTTGRENMTLLEKIVFVGDLIEPNRKYPDVDIMRHLAYKDLDQAILHALDRTIKMVVERNDLLHLNTIKARNDLLILEDLE